MWRWERRGSHNCLEKNRRPVHSLRTSSDQKCYSIAPMRFLPQINEHTARKNQNEKRDTATSAYRRACLRAFLKTTLVDFTSSKPCRGALYTLHSHAPSTAGDRVCGLLPAYLQVRIRHRCTAPLPCEGVRPTKASVIHCKNLIALPMSTPPTLRRALLKEKPRW